MAALSRYLSRHDSSHRASSPVATKRSFERSFSVSFVVTMLFAFVAFLALSSFVSAAITGCCKPNEGTGSCFTGEGSFPDQASFNDACLQLPGTMVPSVTTCAGIPDCTIGCCCAAANVPNSAQINDDEEHLKMTRNSCVAKSTPSATYNFRSLDKPTCVEVCGGTPPVGPGTTHTVSGSA